MKRVALAVALTLTTASVASALPLTLMDNGGAAQQLYTTPSNNDVIPRYEGYLGADLFLTAAAGSWWRITFSFVGSESGWTNVIDTPGGGLSEAPGSVSFLLQAGGESAGVLIPFSFRVNGAPNQVVNGSNGNASNYQSFFVSFDDRTRNRQSPTTGYTALIAFDDGGAGPDDNHDDHVARITAELTSTAVPEPGTLLTIAVGLAGAAGWRRRRA